MVINKVGQINNVGLIAALHSDLLARLQVDTSTSTIGAKQDNAPTCRRL